MALASEIIRSDSDTVLANRISALQTDRDSETVPAGADDAPSRAELRRLYDAEISRLRDVRQKLQEAVGESV